MQVQFFSVSFHVIYHFNCILLAYIPHLWPISPISPMHCFYRPVYHLHPQLLVELSCICRRRNLKPTTIGLTKYRKGP